VFIQISERHHRFRRSPWRRSGCFLNNEGVKSVNGAVIVTNSRYARLELSAGRSGDFYLRQPFQNGTEAYPTSRSIDAGPFFPGNKAGGTWSWQLISTWCQAYGWVEVYVNSILLLASLRSVKSQLLSTSAYFIFSLFSSSFSSFICFSFILYCSHYSFSLSFCFLYVVSVRPYLFTHLLLLIFFSARRDVFLYTRAVSLSRLRDHSHTTLGRTSLDEW
jgi:hypothetical protein